MKKLFCFVAVAATAFLSSCNNDDNSNTNSGNTTPPPPTEENPVTSIVLSSDAATIELGAGSFTFNVASQAGNNLTAGSAITINNAAIQGNVFTPTEAGTFIVKATYQELTSNTVTVTVTSPEPDNMFKINNGEPVITNSSNLIYAGTQQNINIWGVIVRDGEPGTDIDTEPANYGVIIFTTLQPEGQTELAYPSPGNITYTGGVPGTLQAQFKTSGDNATEIYSLDTTTALNINLMDLNTTASTWKFEYNLELQDGTKVNGYFNGNYSYIDDSSSELDRKSNTKLKRLSPAKIKENIANMLKR